MQDQTHSPEAGAAEDAPPEGGSVILKPVFLPAAAVIIGLIADGHAQQREHVP